LFFILLAEVTEPILPIDKSFGSDSPDEIIVSLSFPSSPHLSIFGTDFTSMKYNQLQNRKMNS